VRLGIPLVIYSWIIHPVLIFGYRRVVFGIRKPFREVIEDGLSDKMKPGDSMAIFPKLNDLIQKMTQNQQLDSELERQAYEFLKRGQTLVKGVHSPYLIKAMFGQLIAVADLGSI
jgi:hypothetical protein